MNFTWSSPKKYTYHFDRLTTSDETILKPPTISIDAMGTVPKNPQGIDTGGQREDSIVTPDPYRLLSEFSVWLPCSENSGIAIFSIGLMIQTKRTGKPLPGTPLRLTLKKECALRGMDSDDDNYNHRSSIIASPQGSVFTAFISFKFVLFSSPPNVMAYYINQPTNQSITYSFLLPSISLDSDSLFLQPLSFDS